MSAAQNQQQRAQPSNATRLYWQVITTDSLWGSVFDENTLPRYREPIGAGKPQAAKGK